MLRTPKFWQSKGIISTLLLPLAKLYHLISSSDLQKKASQSRALPKPVIVIGNINMGGTGKTPATIAITQALQAKGLKIGILTRGFGRSNHALTIVSADSTSREIGDEPYLIYQKTDAPMAVYADRYEAGLSLLAAYPDIDCFICDDALQHRQLQRDIEIIIVGKQGFGNERLFPAGPLREPLTRLAQADYILSNNADPLCFTPLKKRELDTPIIHLQSKLLDPYNLTSKQTEPFSAFKNIPFTAVAGIAHPENFYTMLTEKGLQFNVCSFPDHFHFTEADLRPIQTPILMTEKDASKCLNFNREDLWAVPLENHISASFIEALITRISIKK